MFVRFETRHIEAFDFLEFRFRLAKVSKNPILSKEMRRRISSYKRHGFHPDDRDTSELLECWTERLFGEKGQLSDRLKGPSAA